MAKRQQSRNKRVARTREPETEPESARGDEMGMAAIDDQQSIPAILPILPIRGTVVFPGTVMPLGIGRPSSRAMLDECLPQSKIIALFTQRDEEMEDPRPSDLYPVGVAAAVLKLMRQPDETVSIVVHGLKRIGIERMLPGNKYMRAKVKVLEEVPGEGKLFEASARQLTQQARQLIEMSPNAPDQALTVLLNIENPAHLADFLGANLNIDLAQKQDLLEQTIVDKRIRSVLVHVSKQLENLKLQAKIQADVQSSIGKSQHKMFLREQLKAIQRELGEDEDSNAATIRDLKQRLEAAAPPPKVMAEAQRDLNRLESIHPASPEFSMMLSYLELIVDLPWSVSGEEKIDLDKSRRILDRDHFDLEKVKRRLIEYLAVRKLNPDGRGPILCLVGPPGVGKTSLGQSVADALGRRFARLSLGGIRDEAEVRGHRRTYIGAMPGRIIQEIRRAGQNNPVMMLDELDKLGSDFRGDPASALLEVLDPRQNSAFVDRYLDVPFDLSRILFIATANYMGNVPSALSDRMEVIEIPGYSDHDKVQIARRFLVPRQLKENGLKRRQCTWLMPALHKVINDYTRESGVRELERQIGAVSRAIAAEVAQIKKPTKRTWRVDAKLVAKYLGPEKYFRELDSRTRTPGVVCGLAYTPVGGELLFIEATSYPGRGRVQLTGKLGDIMKESADAALSLFKSTAKSFGIDPRKINRRDLHIHVPAGAVPKDGPSAGIAMFTAIASLMLDVPVIPKLAMTGELTLRGRVLPIGGLKEKTLAASRAGIAEVILPELNRRDLAEIDPRVAKALRFTFVQTVDEVLEASLGKHKLKEAVQKATQAGMAVRAMRDKTSSLGTGMHS
ncbi:MAG: endopeptidase La [Phycisphaeraceae bacterium]|nr:endopeptidase La [Phycisphaeraceae bacterium]